MPIKIHMKHTILGSLILVLCSCCRSEQNPILEIIPKPELEFKYGQKVRLKPRTFYPGCTGTIKYFYQSEGYQVQYAIDLDKSCGHQKIRTVDHGNELELIK